MMESDNEEDGVVSYRNKYRQLKSRLKYLIYVSNAALVYIHRCRGYFINSDRASISCVGYENVQGIKKGSIK